MGVANRRRQFGLAPEVGVDLHLDFDKSRSNETAGLPITRSCSAGLTTQAILTTSIASIIASPVARCGFA